MGITSDLRVIYNLTLHSVKGENHQDRLESFYQGQANDYDSFRKNLLHGRELLWNNLPITNNAISYDLGGGTASNLEFLGPRIIELQHITVVDLSRSLLNIAEQRIQDRGWNNVSIELADVTDDIFPPESADLVTFSYSLTMIPDWFAALENAYQLLKPGGVIGIVDFYVSRKYAMDSLNQHGWFTRTFWQKWFEADGVYLSPDHLPWLRKRFETEFLEETKGKMPYMLGMKVPYFVFIGRKPS